MNVKLKDIEKIWVVCLLTDLLHKRFEGHVALARGCKVGQCVSWRTLVYVHLTLGLNKLVPFREAPAFRQSCR